MAKRKTWREKMENGREPHVVALTKPFAGVPAGGRLLISSPAEVERTVRRIASGKTLSPVELRRRLAERHGADAACPTSTSIFLRIVAEAALEEVAGGRPLGTVAPFWRAIDPDSTLAKKLSCGPDLIRQQRALEARGVEDDPRRPDDQPAAPRRGAGQGRLSDPVSRHLRQAARLSR